MNTRVGEQKKFIIYMNLTEVMAYHREHGYKFGFGNLLHVLEYDFDVMYLSSLANGIFIYTIYNIWYIHT